jgi:hypothetical protein
VTLGKLGSMYFGEMPSCTNWLNVGVMFRKRKSARNPSSEIRIVVGAKSDVPFDTIVAADLLAAGIERRYATTSRTTKKAAIDVYMPARRQIRALLDYIIR